MGTSVTEQSIGAFADRFLCRGRIKDLIGHLNDIGVSTLSLSSESAFSKEIGLLIEAAAPISSKNQTVRFNMLST